jgi:predicted RecA/RadA family phage recombinase
MMLKKGMQIATRTIANGQNGAGLSGMFVIPKTDVTNVRGYQ